MGGPIWNDAMVDRLRAMLQAGMTRREMAAELGFSRCAVIGKLTRLGLTDPNRNPIKRLDPADSRPAKTRRKSKGPDPVPCGIAPWDAPKPKPDASTPEIKVPRGRPEENRHTPAPHPTQRGPRPSAGIWRPKTCQFPIGDPRDAGFHFCGAKITPDGRSYCDDHAARCYLPRPTKAPGAPSDSFSLKVLGR